MLLLDEYGDEIEADLMHYYNTDVLGFYTGDLTARRLGVLVTDLMKRPGSSLVRAVNDGRPGWSPGDHLLADLWRLTVQVHSKDPSSAPDHPVRAAMEEKARSAAKATRVSELKDRFERIKNRYRKAGETGGSPSTISE